MRVAKPYSIIHRDESLIVVNKSPGFLSVPGRSTDTPDILTMLRSDHAEVLPVHRIDRDTSGVVVYARSAEVHAYLSGLFENRRVEKHYLAIVIGSPYAASGTIDISLRLTAAGKVVADKDGKPSVTHFETVESFGGYTLVRAIPDTGRTHQIRVHFAEAGFPLAFDPLYGPDKPLTIADIKRRPAGGSDEHGFAPLIARTPLHAERLAFTDHHANPRAFQCEMPRDMEAFCRQLRKWRAK